MRLPRAALAGPAHFPDKYADAGTGIRPPMDWQGVSGSADYERRFRLGAIRVRRDAADEARRQACDAFLAGDFGSAYRLHVEADQHEDAIEHYSIEIGLINLDMLRQFPRVRLCGQRISSQQELTPSAENTPENRQDSQDASQDVQLQLGFLPDRR